MTSAARRVKLEYLGGVKGEAARLEQSEQAAALLAALRPEEASCNEFGELLLSLGPGWDSWALLRALRGWLFGARLWPRVPQDAASRPRLPG